MGHQRRGLSAVLLLVLTTGCGGCERSSSSSAPPPGEVGPGQRAALGGASRASLPSEEAVYIEGRRTMVEAHLRRRGIRDERVLAAMGRVRRQLFVPAAQRRQTYADYPLPIGSGQTISQPYVVAFMTEALGLTGSERVLEVGTGSGYQAAILAELSQKVYSVEIIESLSRTAGEVLGQLGYDNVHLRVGDGYGGWPEKAPFQAIMVTAAPDHVPPALLEQLAPGGKMVLPVGRHYQDLVLIERRGEGFHRRKILPVRFVPMRGAAEKASGRAQ